MTDKLISRINRRLDVMGLSAASASSKAGLSKDAIRNIQRAVSAGQKVGISTKTLTALAKVLQTTPTWLLEGIGQEQAFVPLIGAIQTGGLVKLVDETFEKLSDAPPNALEGTNSLVVEGNAMMPAYEPGTVLYYASPSPIEACVNKRCVIKMEDGRMYTRILRHGTAPGLWCMQSINPLFEDIVDVRVEWVAKIDWVKPAL